MSNISVDIAPEVPSKAARFVKQLAYYIPETVNYLEVRMDHMRDRGRPTGAFQLELRDPHASSNRQLVFMALYDMEQGWLHAGRPVSDSAIRNHFLGAAESFASKNASLTLKDELLRLGAENPDLQDDIRPLLEKLASGRTKKAVVVLDSKYLRSSIQELEMAACVKIAAICAHEATANSNALVQQGAVDLISIDLDIELDQMGAFAFGRDNLRMELRPNERALYYGSRKLAEFSKGESIESAGKRLGKILASWLRGL